MAIQIRVPRESDFPAFMLPVWRAFGDPDPPKEDLDDTWALWEEDRGLAAHDGTEWVGATGAFTFDLTVPGGTTAPAAGVTMVGVSGTHRRKGILTELMRRQLDDVAARDESLAVLTASETGIYGRFGYGLATSASRLEIDATRGAFRLGTEHLDDGRLQVLPIAEADAPVREAYDRCRLLRAGAVTRNDAYWQRIWNDRTFNRDGHSALFVVLHSDSAGRPDGFVTYRVEEHWSRAALPSNRVVCDDLYGATPDVEAALWRFLLDVDLSDSVVGLVRPVDDPIRWRLTEPRRAQVTALRDWLWLRVLDVPAALAARRYEVDGTLVLDVVDAFRPAAGGRFRLEVAGGSGAVERTDAEPDLVLAADDLGAVYLGGVAPSTLAAARRVRPSSPEALARADALFRTTPAPYCGTMF